MGNASRSQKTTEGTVIQAAPEKLRHFVSEVLRKEKVELKEANLVAKVLVEADLRGVDSHGVTRLSGYITMIRSELINPRPNVRVVKEEGATSIIDGDSGFGMLGAKLGMETAIEKARNFGISMATARNLTHTGMIGFYTMMAADQGMIGLAMNNGAAIVPPFGGVTPTFGTNPFSVAFPGSKNHVVLDMATTTVAAGKLRLAAKKGDPIPLDWGFDRHGNPTSDPREVLQNGLLQWAGGYKGFGLATMIEVLGGILSGGLFGRNVPPLKEFGRDPIIANGAYIAIDVEKFMPLSYFSQRLEELTSQIQTSALGPGVKRILVAGQPEFELKEQRSKEGIPIISEVYNELLQLSEDYSIKFDLI
ncbi:MAG: Malate/lactate/ureidoglycolate dehydrogenase, LDH2 family [Chloroflexi bacterium]|jgi:LDH2 family malate/lactate/ureidoglycolate dehydrogenase|nr:MAG: Malate/lactate/ureidoglycolate dehydrogenase, LDH2 family [Chloroflexota bacterium]